LPQKRRTLSSGFSQYQHEPLAGKLWRDRTGANGGASDVAVSASLSGKLSCIVSTIHPSHQRYIEVLQQDYFSGILRDMRIRKSGNRHPDPHQTSRTTDRTTAARHKFAPNATSLQCCNCGQSLRYNK
jgi:hypothetical protein